MLQVEVSGRRKAMTPGAYVILGKSGDILSTLPILFRHYRKTHKQPVVVTSQEYMPLFDRIPFVQTVDLNSEWSDLTAAMKFAKSRFNHVCCLATYGKDYPVEQRTSSFQLEQYERAGLLKEWDSLPFAGLSKSDPIEFKQPTILFADASMSSPFLQKEDLHKLLIESFPKHQIVRLSMIKLPHLVDFVAWYDAAEAVVTIETAHLHLTAATKTPVVALATDLPSRWHGSAWSKRFAFYCRYSEFDNRKAELVDRLKEAMTGKKQMDVMELN